MPILKGTGNTLLCSRFVYGKRISTRAKSVNSDTGTLPTGQNLAHPKALMERVTLARATLGSRPHSLFGDDAVRADGEGDDYVVVNHEQDAVAIRQPKVEDLMTMPGDAFQLVAGSEGYLSWS